MVRPLPAPEAPGEVGPEAPGEVGPEAPGEVGPEAFGEVGPEALGDVAARVRPVVLAHEQALDVPGPLGPLLDGGLVRGSVLVVDGPPGTGRTSVLLHLLAAVTAAGEWAAIVTRAGTVTRPACHDARHHRDRHRGHPGAAGGERGRGRPDPAGLRA